MSMALTSLCRTLFRTTQSFIPLNYGITRTFSFGSVFMSSKFVPPSQPKPEIDRWDEEHALFGENDFKDILGDGSYKLKKNVKVGPYWLRGWKGNEYERLIRKRKFDGPSLGPIAAKDLCKRINYLFRKMNKNSGIKRLKRTERKPYDF
ncbi:large ribosomal subunit protein mL51-like [Glandiceps talaboti]